MALPRPSPDGPHPERSARGQRPPRNGAERRQWGRARAEWPISIQLEDGVHRAKLRDVSRGGICFFLDRPVREMTALAVEFELPVDGGVRRIRGSGAVVRCERISAVLDHYEIAVFLQEMAPPDRETVEAYVQRWRGEHV